MSSKQVYTLIVEDKPIVAEVRSTRTIVDTIVVGTSPAPVDVTAAPSSSSETVTVGQGNHPIGLVVNNETIVEKVIIGTPITNVRSTFLDASGLENKIQELVDSSYINLRVDHDGIDSELVTRLIDSAYINARVNDGIDSDLVINLIDSDYISERIGDIGGKLVWITSGDNEELRINTGFRDDAGGIVQLIREARFNNDTLLEIELATFTPSLVAEGQLNLYWDEPASQWSVSVINPNDFTSQYIEEIGPLLINPTAGVFATVSGYTTTGPDSVPAGGVDWNQTFTTNPTATIKTTTSDLNGGSAQATVRFLDNFGSVIGTDDINYTWRNANCTINFSNLSGKTFLEEYASVNYTVGITGISNLSNAASLITPTGGTISNGTGSGLFTFTEPLNKDNNDGSRSVALSTTFSRPSTVSTADSYNVVDTASDATISASYTFPSFWLFTSFAGNPPQFSDVVEGNSFASGVNVLGNQSKNIDQFINNPETVPQAFWLGIRSSATQPTIFQTGISAALLSDVVVTTGNILNLQPDTPPAGYVSEEYKLYGITIQPGSTYVRIS